MKIPEGGYDFIAGTTLLIDKPKDWTSFDVVNKVRGTLRRILNVKKLKVGHSGTLDPMATGLLVICTGKHTKKLTELTGLDKVYTGTLKLGETTPSYDAETPVDQTYPVDHITKEMVLNTALDFLGIQEQVPPVFSAIKVKGEAAYKKARKGVEIIMKSREVDIKSFEIVSFESPFVSFKVHCGKGTYIRSLAYDFGKKLRSGAHLVQLERNAIGDYNLENSWNLEEFILYLETEFKALPED